MLQTTVTDHYKWPSIIGWICAFYAKNRELAIRAGSVNAPLQRSKKNLKNFDFWFALSALLIEKPQITQTDTERIWAK